MKALVVDDSRGIRMIVARAMKAFGFDVVEAGDGREALERLADSGPFEVAMVDWNMPVMTGIEFIRAVKKDERYRDLAVVMVTTESEQHRVVAALAAGASEYVMKPFTADILGAKLELLGLLKGTPQ
jgi:two-component system chemotaxis response regulator CheY